MAYPAITTGVHAVVFPDPVVKLRAWVQRFESFGRVYSEEPSSFATKLPFLIVRESGGPGVHDRIYTRVRLQFECWATDSAKSSAAAQQLAALIRVWDQYEDVWNPLIIQDPTDMPDPDSGTPVHRLAAEVSFVGEEQEISILSIEGA